MTDPGTPQGRRPAPRSGGAGPERPARSTRWRGGPFQPTGPRLRPTSASPVPAPCLSCRGLATSAPTHRKARTNSGRGGPERATPGFRGEVHGRGVGQASVHRATLSTAWRTASTPGRPESTAHGGSARCRRPPRDVSAVHGLRPGLDPRRPRLRPTLDTLHACAVHCRSSASMVDEDNRRRESC